MKVICDHATIFSCLLTSSATWERNNDCGWPCPQARTPDHSYDCVRTTGKQAGTELLLVCPIIRIQTRQPISNFAGLKGACQASPDTSKICRVRADTIEFCGYSAVVGSITDRIREIRLAGKPPCWACLRTASSSGATYMQ